jgi:hypothetical protein
MSRPSQSIATARARVAWGTDRESYEVGRMGIRLTRKKPGDHVWNGLKQEWEVVGNG